MLKKQNENLNVSQLTAKKCPICRKGDKSEFLPKQSLRYCFKCDVFYEAKRVILPTSRAWRPKRLNKKNLLKFLQFDEQKTSQKHKSIDSED